VQREEHIRVGLHVILRMLQGFVLWPSAALGCLALTVGLLGGSPFRDAIAGIYSWADTSVRGAPAGMVMTYECARERAATPVRCKQVAGKPRPAEDAIAEAEGDARGVYEALVVLSFTVMVFTMGWRQFLGLKNAPDTGARAAG